MKTALKPTHTPTPWFYRPELGAVLRAPAGYATEICVPGDAQGTKEDPLHDREDEKHANGYLIAASPDLLAALNVANEALGRLLATGRFDSKASLGAIARAQYGQSLAESALAKASGIS